MPEAVAYAIEYLYTAEVIGFETALAATAAAGTIASGAMLVGGLAYSSAQKRKAARAARDAYNSAQVDRLVNVVSTVAPRELVLGRVRKAGTVFFRASTDTNNTKFVMLVALAGHEIDAVETIYLNDVAVTLDGSGYVTDEPYAVARRTSAAETFTGTSITLAHTPIDDASVTVVLPGGTGPTIESQAIAFTRSGATITVDAGYSGYTKTVQYQWNDPSSKVKITTYLGTAGQTADSAMVTDFPTLWSSAHRARGVAYLKVECTYDEQAFPSGLPSVSATIRGAKVYDPRTATTAWSENPALMMRHVLLHPQFGKRSSITSDEDARITTAANACDTATTYTVGGVAQASRALYKAGIVVPFGAPARDVLDDLTQAMAGSWAYAAGQFYVRAGAYSASVLTLTDADLATVSRRSDGGLDQRATQIVTHQARDQMFNVVTPTIWDSAQDYKRSALTPLKSSTLITRDGAELVREVVMPAVTYAPQALHIAGVMMRDARDPLTVSLSFKLTAYRVELFDTVALTISRYGWSGKLFMVTGRDWTHDGSIRLTLKETASSIFTMDANFSAQGGADNTGLPAPWDLPAITITDVSSGVSQRLVYGDGRSIPRVCVTWAAQTDLMITQGGRIEVQYRHGTTTSAWETVSVAGAETQVLISGLSDKATYIFRARAVTPAAVGPWGAQFAHKVEQVEQGGFIGVLASRDEGALGWSGTKSGFSVLGAGADRYLEGAGAQTWNNVANTWNGWTYWNASPTSPATYTANAVELGTAQSGQVVVYTDADGTVATEISVSQDYGVTWSAWSDVLTFVGTNVKARVTVTGSIPTVRALRWQIRGPMHTEQRNNLSPADLPSAYRVGTGNIYVPMSRAYSALTVATVTAINDSTGGSWTWRLALSIVPVGPNPPGPQFMFYKDGVLTDPEYVSIYLEGY